MPTSTSPWAGTAISKLLTKWISWTCQLNNLLQYRTNFDEVTLLELAHGMRWCLTNTPVKGFWLVAEEVTGFSSLRFYVASVNGKRIVCVVFCSGHRQPNHLRGLGIEVPGWKHQERVHVAHFIPSLRVTVVTVNSDDVLSCWHPFGFGVAFNHQCSAPIGVVSMISPPCRCMSNCSRRCSRVGWGSFSGVMMTRPSLTSTLTRWSTCRFASRAKRTGIRTPRLLPQRLMSSSVWFK